MINKIKLLLVLTTLSLSLYSMEKEDRDNVEKEKSEELIKLNKEIGRSISLPDLDITGLPLELKELINIFLREFKILNQFTIQQIVEGCRISKCARVIYFSSKSSFSIFTKNKANYSFNYYERLLSEIKKLKDAIWLMTFQATCRRASISDFYNIILFSEKLKFKAEQFNKLISILFRGIPPIKFDLKNQIFSYDMPEFDDKVCHSILSPSKNYFIKTDSGKSKIWDIKNCNLVFQDPVDKVDFSDDDKYLLSAERSGGLSHETIFKIYVNEGLSDKINEAKNIDQQIEELANLKISNARLFCLGCSRALSKTRLIIFLCPILATIFFVYLNNFR